MRTNFLAVIFFVATVIAAPIDSSAEPPAPTSVQEHYATITNGIKSINLKLENTKPAEMVKSVGRTINSFLPENYRDAAYMQFDNVVSNGMTGMMMDLFSRRSGEL